MNVTCAWADTLDRANVQDALRVGEPHHLEQHGRRVRGYVGTWVRGYAGRVVPELGIAVRVVDFVVEQLMQRMLERTV